MVQFISPIDLREDPLLGFKSLFTIGEGLRSVIDYLQGLKEQQIINQVLSDVGRSILDIKPMITTQDKMRIRDIVKEGQKQGLTMEQIDEYIKQSSGGRFSLKDFDISTPEERTKKRVSELEEKLQMSLAPHKIEEIRKEEEEAYKSDIQRQMNRALMDALRKATQQSAEIDRRHSEFLGQELAKKSLGQPNIIDLFSYKNPYGDAIRGILGKVLQAPVRDKGALLQAVAPVLNVLAQLDKSETNEILNQMRMELLSSKLALSERGLELREAALEQRERLGEAQLELRRQALEAKRALEEHRQQLQREEMALKMMDALGKKLSAQQKLALNASKERINSILNQMKVQGGDVATMERLTAELEQAKEEHKKIVDKIMADIESGGLNADMQGQLLEETGQTPAPQKTRPAPPGTVPLVPEFLLEQMRREKKLNR